MNTQSLRFKEENSNSLRLLRRKAQQLRRETGDDRWIAPIEKLQRSVAQTVLRSMYRPVLLLTLEPMCICLCIFSAILLGILYLFFGAFQLVFSEVYGMVIWQRGLCFIGLFVGMVMAILSDPIWRRNYIRLERNHEKATNKFDDFQPEWRLPSGKFVSMPFWNQRLNIMKKSHLRWPLGHYRSVHLCLDNLPQCPLDCAYHRKRAFWSRVRSIFESHLTRSPHLALIP